MIQDITRPLGILIQHSSIPFQNSMQSQTMMQNMAFLKERMADMTKMADEMQVLIDTTERMYAVMRELDTTTTDMARVTAETSTITDELRDHLAEFDDFWRPMRSYFYWEKHCFDVPICWSFRSLFDSLDGIDKLSEVLRTHRRHTAHGRSHVTDADFDSPMIATMKTTKALTLTMQSTFSAMLDQMDELSNTAIVMGQSFDASKNDDFFYLPPEAFDNPDFQTGLRMFLSPDGKSARFFITHQGDPMTPEEFRGSTRNAQRRRRA